jgi:hypothetical protein
MKKRKLKSLQLNKKSISNLKVATVKGGNPSDWGYCESDYGSCYWQLCAPSGRRVTDCYCPPE